MSNLKEKPLQDKSVSIVVPVYNGEKTLAELADRVDRTMRPLIKAFEIIYVNDGSRDNSWNVIQELAEQRTFVRGFNLMTNYGQHNALFAGIQEARFEIIVTMDDDLQHPPEEIPKLLNMLCSGYDVVYGRPDGSYWERFPDSHTPAWYSPMGAKPDPAVDREYFITNPDPDYNHFGMVGTWYRTAITLENTGGALGLDYRYTNPGSGSRKAIFTFYVRDAGMYAVLATWQAQPQNASNAQFTINHSGFYGGPSPTVVEVDQRVTSPYLINQLGAFYFTPGTNTIELSDLANGVVVADLVALMPLGNPSSLLRAEFGADVVAGSGPLAVQFTDASFTYGDGALFLEDPAIAAWEWDFGDGTTSGEQNPLHTYAEPGLYTVSLTITDEGGAQSTETREEFIAVDTPPALQAEFMADTLYGSTQTLVRFQDQSSGEIASWHWDFGDGVTSAERNPQHVFRSTGTFTVTLTVTGPSGSDTRVKEDYIYNMTPWLIVDNTFEYKPHYYSTYRGRDIGVVIMDASGINLKSEELKYSRFFYNSCFTGKYFLNTFNRGVVFFTHANSREPRPEGVYIRRYLEGYSDEEIKGFLNALNYEEDENSVQFGLYDYYDFTKPPPSMR